MSIQRLAPILIVLVLIPAASLPDKQLKKDSADKDYAAELPRIPPKEPAESLKAFQLRPGLLIELVAAEPLVQSPMACDFDEDGRLFVVELPEYNQYASSKPHGRGRVVLLEDTDGDGRFDKRTVYVDDLDYPTAVACWDSGVFVGAAPDIWYCKAGKREKVFTGFGKDRAGEGHLNSFRWGFDNRFHVCTGINGGEVHPVAGSASDRTAPSVQVRGHGFLFDPRTRAFELTGGGGQHGMSRDDWGRTFVCGNSDPVHLVMYDSRYLTRNPYLPAPAAAVNIAPGGKFTKLYRLSEVEPWRALRTRLRSQGIVPGSDEGGQPAGFFTGATGITVYRGDAWPAEYRGGLVLGEVANNLIHRMRLEAKGVELVAHPAEKESEFLASKDIWFRPVQFANGPDGTLYVLDMYRELIEGAAFLAPQVLKHVDPSNGVERGRIWRIVPEGFQQPKLPRLGKATTAELVGLLEHANGWHRDTASRLLYQRQDAAAVPMLRKLAVQSKTPLGRMHALHALDGLKALEAADVMRGLDDAEPRLREQALRLAERFEALPEIRARFEKLIEDPDIRVRYQLAFSLGNVKGEMPTKALVKLAQRDGADPWFQLAVLSSVSERAGQVFLLLGGEATFRAGAPGRTFLSTLAGQIGAANRQEDVAAVLRALDALTEEDKALTRDIVRALAARLPAAAREQLAGGKTGQVLAELLGEARQTAADAKRSVKDRAAAVRALGLAPFAEVRDLFAGLLGPRQPPPVQAAALETLGRFDQPEVAGLVLGAWPALSPQLRATAAETVFSRPVWLHAFLDAVEKGAVGRGDVEPARIALLQSYPDEKVRQRASSIFAGSKLSKRAEVVAAYQKALLLKGEPTRGKAIFHKECSACHRLEGVGEEVGADLSAVRDRGSEAVLLNILDPNREVLPKYLSYVLVNKGGKVITGLITAESATSLTLRRADGTGETVLRNEIAALNSTGQSFMPEGLEKLIDMQGMADLLAYLSSIK
jgi:putative membrane-bound dehydrogenase-like protein